MQVRWRLKPRLRACGHQTLPMQVPRPPVYERARLGWGVRLRGLDGGTPPGAVSTASELLHSPGKLEGMEADGV